ncbi:MAG: glycosyltransferase [Elusimicrobia bacterium]|nr:glycosyltransferase [Elusimicrobiota bacterium]
MRRGIKAGWRKSRLLDWYRDRFLALRPGLVHAHFGDVGAQLAPLCSELGLPLVVTFYGVDVSAFLREPRWQAPYRRMFSVAAKLVVLCETARDRLIRAGARVGQVELWNCLVDLASFPYAPRVPACEVRFVTAARFIEKKGYFTMLEALARLLSGGVKARLTALGMGPIKESILRRAADLGLRDRFTLIDTAGTPDFIAAYGKALESADIFVLPSTTGSDGDDEGGPALTMVMAQAAGLPVICTPFPGAEITVKEGETGLLCEFDDPESLAERMSFLAARPEMWNALGAAGSRLTASSFDPDGQTQAMVRIYRRALEAAP